MDGKPGWLPELFSHLVLLEDDQRSLQDLEKGACPHYQSSCKYYEGLALQMVSSNYVLDVFACSLDQVTSPVVSSAINASLFGSTSTATFLPLPFTGHRCPSLETLPHEWMPWLGSKWKHLGSELRCHGRRLTVILAGLELANSCSPCFTMQGSSPVVHSILSIQTNPTSFLFPSTFVCLVS